MAWRAVAGLIGIFFLINAAGWVMDPLSAAEGLGMPLLDGIGRSTQIGDIGALFLAMGGLAAAGAWRMNSHWIQAAGILLGSAAVMRTLAWVLHDAAFATSFIVIEAVGAALLILAATKVQAASSGANEA